jgi:aryl-alcohol dehydrogenase-like predicted oxidoreductase
MDHRQPHPELYNAPFIAEDFNGMPYRPLGPSGLRASAVGLGTWKVGHPDTGDGARVDEKTAHAIFDRALQLGVTFWDTANRYNAASGNSERVIGTWLRAHPDDRRNIVLATKVFGGMDGRTPNHSGLSRANILDSVRACLERLQTDRIDLLYFHRFDPRVPVEESLCAIEDLARQDVVRYFGVSNFTVDQLALYRAVEQSLSPRCRVVAVQNRYDILNGESPEHPGVLDYAARHGLSLVAWSPLAMGLLTERYLDPAQAGPGDRLVDEGSLAQAATPAVLARLRRLAELARGWDMQLSQLALACMLGLPGMGPVIPSATTLQQLESNAAAGRIRLDEAQRRAVQEALHP